jgi:hypothetical protein
MISTLCKIVFINFIIDVDMRVRKVSENWGMRERIGKRIGIENIRMNCRRSDKSRDSRNSNENDRGISDQEITAMKGREHEVLTFREESGRWEVNRTEVKEEQERRKKKE